MQQEAITKTVSSPHNPQRSCLGLSFPDLQTGKHEMQLASIWDLEGTYIPTPTVFSVFFTHSLSQSTMLLIENLDSH